jgi:hypothetical protein
MKNNKLLAILLSALLVSLSGCDREPRKNTYIKTERGLINYVAGYCELGMLHLALLGKDFSIHDFS